MDIKKEDIIAETKANHQQNVISIGGKLILTKNLLIFKPHWFNIGGKEVVMQLNEIVDVGKTQTMFGLSKEMWVNSKGTLEHFVVRGRDEFLEALKNQIASSKVDTSP